MAGKLALRVPELAVGVEDAATKEVTEDIGERFALGIIIKVGLEHVLDVVGVRRHDVTPSSESLQHYRHGRRHSKELGVPIQ